jgi:hypothetical protein
LQTVAETLFANRKTKEKKCSKQLTKYALKSIALCLCGLKEEKHAFHFMKKYYKQQCMKVQNDHSLTRWQPLRRS